MFQTIIIKQHTLLHAHNHTRILSGLRFTFIIISKYIIFIVGSVIISYKLDSTPKYQQVMMTLRVRVVQIRFGGGGREGLSISDSYFNDSYY